ncbi:hypothetical protein [Alkalicoccobacillus porphyridii]|uniref:Uncharacterized protein n=1 Tax=Alkalicoccobacillus porphyridii TaxID=2597270 RepID=A0A554A4B8_9BACI|nr:hypothetical protein [Alkalicoccobacillus porphyridii]TSB48540.1 hypothetical protein FN960_03020 [Alkalicoccobacillus porphyridii]
MMWDFFNPWVGSYTLLFDKDDFSEMMQSNLRTVRDHADIGNEAINYAQATLSEQEGTFVDEAVKTLNLLHMTSQSNDILISANAMNHIHSFEGYLNKQAKQKYDIFKELDMAAVERMGKRSHF